MKVGSLSTVRGLIGMLLVLFVLVNVAVSAPHPNPADLTANQASNLNDVNAEDTEDSIFSPIGMIAKALSKVIGKTAKAKPKVKAPKPKTKAKAKPSVSISVPNPPQPTSTTNAPPVPT